MNARLRRTVALTMSLAGTGVLATPSVAFAQAASGDATSAQAAEHFDRGLRLFNDKDDAAALAEFKSAYDIVPNPVVLYNIGLVYASLGRPVDAVAALDRVLANPGTVSGERLERAKQVRAEQAQRIAKVSVVTSVPAAISVDNISVGQTPLTAPLQVAGGVHVVAAYATGYAPKSVEVTVAGGQSADVRLELAMMAGKAAHVSVSTHLPGADVYIDDQRVGTTPLPVESLTVTPGQHMVELRREGYVTGRQTLTLGDGSSASVVLDPDEDKTALATRGGLALDVSETEATITIDGKPRGPYLGSIVLPSGPHRLLVERGGFLPVERLVTVDAGRSVTVRVALDATPETLAKYESRASSQHFWGAFTAISGVAITGASIGLLLANAPKLSAATDAYNAAVTARSTSAPPLCNIRSGGNAMKCNGAVDSANTALDGPQGTATLGYVGLGVGASAILAGLAVYIFVPKDPHRLHKPAATGDDHPSVLPFTWSDARGGGGGLRVTF
jgi:hypothetical protein